MFLTVPLGPDLLAWNLMRRYGRVRLPLLLHGWDVVKTHGFDDARLDMPHAGKRNFRQSWEPVFVLAKGSYSKTCGANAEAILEDEGYL